MPEMKLIKMRCVQRGSEPVWPSGKALGLVSGLRFESASALLSLQKLWSVDTVW